MATRSQCGACRLTFVSVAAFDAHRTGSYGEPIYQETRTGKSHKFIGYTPQTRQCLTLAEIQAKGMTQNEKGWWMLPKNEALPAEEMNEKEEANV